MHDIRGSGVINEQLLPSDCTQLAPIVKNNIDPIL